MEKRSDAAGISRQGDVHQPGVHQSGAVGGRQAGLSLSPGGGGYLTSCMFSSARPRDPRLDDLKKIGLHPTFLKIAETIGVDSWLAAWRILDADPQWQTGAEGSQLRIHLRRYRSYLRLQRNRFIVALAADGLSDGEIQARLLSQMFERLSVDQIRKIRCEHEVNNLSAAASAA